MKKPERRSAAIDLKRYRKWSMEFRGYRHPVSEDRIRDWLNQFEAAHQDIASRLLDCVEFVNNEQIRNAFHTILAELPGWNRSNSERQGKWRFVAYSSSAGESGDSMLHVFRHANNLASNQFNNLFIPRSDLLRADLGKDDTVVLIDDMVGTGNQVCEAWNNIFGELLAEIGQVYLIVVAACDNAIQRIADETDIVLKADRQLHDDDNIFHAQCEHFTRPEKESILTYCQHVDNAQPQGFGDSGLVIVLGHGIPNNSLPILGKTTQKWEPLFRRYD